MTIREYAKKMDHKIVGKLVRRPDLEYTTDWWDGHKKHSGYKHYTDEAGNEYINGGKGCCIVTSNGDVI